MDREAALAEVFCDKPELLLPPEWMLAPAELERLAETPGLAVLELAGRDSVAAALKLARDGRVRALLPTYVYTGSEHGPWSVVPAAWQALRQALDPAIDLHPLLVLGWPQLWRALCGRYLAESVRAFGLAPVCAGCHLYLHAMRAPLARALGNVPVIAGERESHDGKLKLNQVGPALDAYVRALVELGVELLLPLRLMDRGQEITALLGDDWPEGGRQLGCVLSGNYRDTTGGLAWDPADLRDYLDRFAVPLAVRALQAKQGGQEPDLLAIGADLLANTTRP